MINSSLIKITDDMAETVKYEEADLGVFIRYKFLVFIINLFIPIPLASSSHPWSKVFK